MNENTRLLLNNVVAIAAIAALAGLVFLGKAPAEALVAFLTGLVLRPGLPAGQNPS